MKASMIAPPGYSLEEMRGIAEEVEAQLLPHVQADPAAFAAGDTPFPPMAYLNMRVQPEGLRIIAETVDPGQIDVLMVALGDYFRSFPGMRAFAARGSIISSNDGGTRSVNIDIADAKYDITKNYEYIRAKGSIPIIDYNRRRENLSRQALIDRGYDEKGWPFAPCGLLCRPNGFDKKYQRLTFCCFKQCLNLRAAALKNIQEKYDIAMCPHIENRTGFTKHMYVKEHPRLINEIPRGSKRYNLIKKIRSASERANSTMKEDLKILEKPRILNAQRAAILAQMAAIVLLLHRAFKFVVKITILFTKLHQTNDPAIKEKLKPPRIPKSILNLIQLE